MRLNPGHALQMFWNKNAPEPGWVFTSFFNNNVIIHRNETFDE